MVKRFCVYFHIKILQLLSNCISGFLFYLIRRSAEVMSGKGGKRGGLFGAVMDSTAKLINSKDIGVRFKLVFKYIFKYMLCLIYYYI